MTDPQRISPETQTASWPPPPGPEPAPPALPRSFRPQKETPPKKSKPTPQSSKFANFPHLNQPDPLPIHATSTHSHHNPNPPAPKPRSPNLNRQIGENTIKPRRQKKHSSEKGETGGWILIGGVQREDR